MHIAMSARRTQIKCVGRFKKTHMRLILFLATRAHTHTHTTQMGADYFLVNHTKKQFVSLGYKMEELQRDPVNLLTHILWLARNKQWDCDDDMELEEDSDCGYECVGDRDSTAEQKSS